MKQNTTRHTETRKYTHVVQKHTDTHMHSLCLSVLFSR